MQDTHVKSNAESVEDIDQPLTIIKDKLYDWGEAAIALLPNLAVAILVVVAFWFLALLVRKLVKRILAKVMDSRSIAHLLASIAQALVVGVGLFIALGLLGLDKTVTSLLAGAGVIGLALAFAFQDVAANLISGFYMSFRRPFESGDLIETNDTFGTVEAIDLRSTRLRTPTGQIVLIPNKNIFENKLTNFTRSGSRRIDLPVGVSYAEDLAAVKELTIEVIRGIEDIDSERGVEVFYQEFGGSSINFLVRFWIDFRKQSEFHAARSEAIMRIKKAYDEHGISIPFPIRTLDFGIKGGETLRETLAARPSSDEATSATSSAESERTG